MELATATTSGTRKGAKWWKADGSWREQRLRQRIGEGYLYDEIASELGCTVGMVCGKAGRMNAGHGAEKRNALAFLWRPKNQAPPREPDPAFLGISARQRQEAGQRLGVTVHLEKLEDHHCRFVIGDPSERKFCGVRRQGKSSYCAEHAERCSAQLVADERDERAKRLLTHPNWYANNAKFRATRGPNATLWNVNPLTFEPADAREAAPA